MTLLFIGGMLIVALLAILGAVYLVTSEQRADRTRINAGASQISTTTNPVLAQRPAENRQIEQSTAFRQSMPSSEKPVRSTEVNQQPYALNGQFHELAVELQTLYQHAWELERRLRTLAEVADRIEKTNNNQIGTEEELHAQSATDSTFST